jgi:proline dehydrogenase
VGAIFASPIPSIASRFVAGESAGAALERARRLNERGIGAIRNLLGGRYAERRHDESGTPYEVQMLMGVREPAQERLAADREVWQYVPYGGQWLSYFYRRVAERRQNLPFALRAIVN